MSLPEVIDQEREPAPVPEIQAQRPTLRVLVVDDESELLDAMCESLQKLGHSIAGVSSGTSALERLKSETFDLVLSDLRMPGMDGPELYESACELIPRLRHRFVFITGDSLTDRATRFLDRVRLPHVDKPFDLETLRAVVDAFEPIDHEARPDTEIPSA